MLNIKQISFSNRKIAHRFILYILIFSSSITLILTGLQLYFDYKHGIEAIEDSARQIEISYLDGISSSLWVLDHEMLTVQLDGMLRLKDVAHIQVKMEDGSTVEIGDVQTSQLITKQYPLVFTKRGKTNVLGELQIVYTLKNLYNQLLNKAVVIAISQSIKTFLVSGFIFVIFYLLVGRHLQSLSSYAKGLNLDTIEKPFKYAPQTKENSEDELDILTDAINEMRSNLQQSISQLKSEVQDRERSEEALQKSRAFSDSVLSLSPDIIYVYDLVRRKNIYSNDGIMKVLGYTVAEIQSMGEQILMTLMHPDDYETYLANTLERYQAAKDNEVIAHEYRMKNKDGDWRWLLSKESIFTRNDDSTPKQIVGLVTDITDRKLVEDQTKAALLEKDTLLQEIHHRVKNNMQIIASLLRLQQDSEEKKDINTLLNENIGRVYAMASIHESLHQSESLSAIDMEAYIHQLTQLLAQTFLDDLSKVEFNISTQGLSLGIEKANPLGLVLNELISNSLKYAFPGDQTGTISIESKTSTNQVELVISDDGVGIPADFDWKKTKSLGLRLVRDIVENQLEGSIECDPSSGTTFTIRLDY